MIGSLRFVTVRGEGSARSTQNREDHGNTELAIVPMMLIRGGPIERDVGKGWTGQVAAWGSRNPTGAAAAPATP
jgi:hypothetical protein